MLMISTSKNNHSLSSDDDDINIQNDEGYHDTGYNSPCFLTIVSPVTRARNAQLDKDQPSHPTRLNSLYSVKFWDRSKSTAMGNNVSLI